MDTDAAQRISAAVRELSEGEKMKLLALLAQISNPSVNIVMQMGPGQNVLMKGDAQRLLLFAQVALAAAFNVNPENLANYMQSAVMNRPQ